MPNHIIPPHGGYKNLLSFQKAEIVFDATVKPERNPAKPKTPFFPVTPALSATHSVTGESHRTSWRRRVFFCKRFLEKRDRTNDQMIQAARSGKQNIVEGRQASGTSREMELKLTNVARASPEELLNDYLDFLRPKRLPIRDKNEPKAQAVRKMSYGTHVSYETYRSLVEEADPETAANTIICLINQDNYLLDQQIRQLEKAFIQEGGRERMTRAHLQQRAKDVQAGRL